MSSYPRVFIGSSREAILVARGIKANLEEVAEVRIWDEDVFEPGRYTLDELLRFTNSFDFAVFVWSDDDTVVSRGKSVTAPRDNVVLEAGIFYGALGRERVFLFAPRERDTKFPSDLLGLTVIDYRSPMDNNYRAAVSSGCSRLVSLISRYSVSPRQPSSDDATMKAHVFFPNLISAKDAIRAATKEAHDIKILSNKGLVFFGLDDSIISLAEIDDYKQLKRLRMILLDPDSRWINRGLMALRRYETLADFKVELESAHTIAESGMRRFANYLKLHKSGIKYHRVEPYFRMIITDKVAFVSSYAESPSVQVRDLPVFVFENQKGSLYGALRRHFNDLWHNESRTGQYLQHTIETEISAGGILVAEQDGRKYVALVMRDDGSWVLPKGHKERTDCSLEVSAVREVAEEIGLSPETIKIVKGLDEYTYDETAERYNSRKVVFLFLMRYKGDSLPKLNPDPDHLEARWWSLDEEVPYLFYAYQKTLLAEVMANEFRIIVEIA